jgi:hypothetical protein
MASERTQGWSRRDFVRGLTLAGTAELVGLRPGPAHADPPPETTKLRIPEIVPAENLIRRGMSARMGYDAR